MCDSLNCGTVSTICSSQLELAAEFDRPEYGFPLVLVVLADLPGSPRLQVKFASRLNSIS
jgi:hypothetical protein